MQTVQSVERALNILELLSNYQDGLGITEISEKVDLHKSTVHRLLKTLIGTGYVIQNEENKNYLISFKLYELGRRKVHNLDILKISKAHIEKLVESVNETVHLVIRDRNMVLYIDKVQPNNNFIMGSKIGVRSPMYCTSVGKSILAYSDEEDIKSVWDSSEIIKHTDKTITNYEEFLEDLKLVRENGYALDNEENEIGVRCIGAPILNRNGKVKAAISISGPTIRMTDDKMKVMEEKLLETVKNISGELGYI